MSQYARELPVDKNNNAYLTGIPNFVANQSWASVFTVSSTVGLSDRTTVVQISTVGQPVNFKWGAGPVTGTSFDGTVMANTSQVYVVPQSVFGRPTSVMGANGQNGLYNSISLISLGTVTAGSVFGCEF
jgi:hypothetical protein